MAAAWDQESGRQAAWDWVAGWPAFQERKAGDNEGGNRDVGISENSLELQGVPVMIRSSERQQGALAAWRRPLKWRFTLVKRRSPVWWMALSRRHSPEWQVALVETSGSSLQQKVPASMSQ